jgi:transcriptional regulator with XRE-family HTH domain
MGDIISLGLWIKRRRKALDLTQDQLAQRIGCSLALIQKIEADARRPSREIAARLAVMLELAADERAAFIQAARAELGADRLAPPAQTVARGAFMPAQAVSSAADTPGQRRSTRPNNLPTPRKSVSQRADRRQRVGGGATWRADAACLHAGTIRACSAAASLRTRFGCRSRLPKRRLAARSSRRCVPGWGVGIRRGVAGGAAPELRAGRA